MLRVPVLFSVQSPQDLWRQQQGCAEALASHPISVPAEVSPLQPAPRAEGKHGKKGNRRSEADELLAEVHLEFQVQTSTRVML